MIRSVLLLAVGVFVAGCSGLGPAAPDPGPDTPDSPAPTYPAYETFDPAGYDAEPTPVAATIIHDVPPGVMEGRVNVPGNAPAPAPAEPQPTQMEGFRVQVFSSASRDAAERVRDEAVRWWEGAQQAEGAPATMEAIVAYLQPYYRVRLGAFADRDDAEAALALVRRQYPEAFLVPDTVTVMR